MVHSSILTQPQPSTPDPGPGKDLTPQPGQFVPQLPDVPQPQPGDYTGQHGHRLLLYALEYGPYSFSISELEQAIHATSWASASLRGCLPAVYARLNEVHHQMTGRLTAQRAQLTAWASPNPLADPDPQQPGPGGQLVAVPTPPRPQPPAGPGLPLPVPQPAPAGPSRQYQPPARPQPAYRGPDTGSPDRVQF